MGKSKTMNVSTQFLLYVELKNGLKWGFLRGQKPNEIPISFELKIHIKNKGYYIWQIASLVPFYKTQKLFAQKVQK